MHTFKTFLLNESVYFILHKPQTTGRYVPGWLLSKDWTEVYKLPSSLGEYNKASEESGSIRLFLTRDGKLLMWSGGVLHDIAGPQLKLKHNEYMHLYYDKGNDFIFADRANHIPKEEKLLKNVEKNRDVFQRSFNNIRKTFPRVNRIIFEDKFEIFIKDPFEIKEMTLV